MSDKQVTVVTPCYNHGLFLDQAIESVLGQIYEDFDYILVDDGSTDNSHNIMLKYAAQDTRITIIKMPKQPNWCYPLNVGIKLMTTPFWVWAPADDILHKDLLLRKLDVAQKNQQAVIYSDSTHVDKNGKIIKHSQTTITSNEQLYTDIWQTTELFGFTGIWIPKAVFNIVGMFPEHIQYSGDFWWLIRATQNRINFIRIAEELFCKRFHRGQLSQRIKLVIKQHVKDIRCELDEYGRGFKVL